MELKGQVFLFVLILLLVATILTAGLAVMLQAELQVRSLERDSSLGFYLAQAGLERAKIEILKDVRINGSCPGASYCPASANPNWYEDLDVSTDNYRFYYKFSVSASGNQRTLTAQGEVQDSNANVLASRIVRVTVDGIRDRNSDNRDDNPPNNSIVAWSWRES